MNALEKARALVEEIRANAKPLDLLDNWKLAGRLLGRMPCDQAALQAAVSSMDLQALDAIVSGLESPGSPPPAAPAADAPEISHDDKAAALRAFKKRLKLARLNDESKLGGRYTSGGRTSQIDAIQPPSEFGSHVWRALVADGRLEDTGQGFYKLKA